MVDWNAKRGAFICEVYSSYCIQKSTKLGILFATIYRSNCKDT